MDEMVLAALAKWPNVPDVYGWLKLDGRGDWLILDSRVSHAGLSEFMHRNVGVDERGACFVQNGPQRVFYQYATAPCVVSWQAATWQARPQFDLSCGIDHAWWVDEGALYLGFGQTLAAVDDRDLPLLLGCLYHADARPLDDWPQAGAQFIVADQRVPLEVISRTDLLHRYQLCINPDAQQSTDCVLGQSR